MKQTFSIAIAAALALTTPAIAGNMTAQQIAAANKSDAECLTHFSVLLGQNDEPMPEDGRNTAGIAYYFGAIEARSPDLDIAPLVNAAATEMDVDSGPITTRCEAELLSIGDRLLTLSENIGQ